MKKLFTSLLLFIGIATIFEAKATHPFGAYITYENVAPNIYRVDYRYVKPCNNFAFNTSVNLNYRAVGCSTTTGTKNLPLISTTSSGVYSQGAQTLCTVTPPATSNNLDFEILTYSDTITLTDTCSNWLLSVRQSGRGPAVNTSSNGYVYVEAMLNNSQAALNSSPQFYQNPIKVLPLNKLSIFNHGVVDPDGDSLVYSLLPIQYHYQFPWLYDSGFSAQQPFGPNANPGLYLDSVNGMMQVKPTVYNGINYFNNIYFIGIMVEEYRKINGNYVKIGHIRNDVPFWVLNDTTNQMPNLISLRVNNAQYNSGDIVNVTVGSQVTLQFQATDPDLSNQLSFVSNQAQVLKNATLAINGSSANPTYTLNWTPTASDLRDQPYFISVDVQDNHTPAYGSSNHVIGLRVQNVSSVKDQIKLNSPLIPSVLVKGQTFQLDEQLRNVQITILNSQGQVVKQADHYQNDWKGNELASGMYFYKIIQKESQQAYTGKILLTN